MFEPILLVGLSMRMLAELAVRAGCRVIALDYFGDVDLRTLCPGSKSLRRDFGQAYSAEALALAGAEISTPAVSYGASLENHPDVVARLARGRVLLGNPPAVLKQVRDPFRLAAVLRAKGYLFPQILTSTEVDGVLPGSNPTHRWLWKPHNSGGGHSIRWWTDGPLPEQGLVQQYLPGLVCSALFVANGRQAALLGITEQLVGQSTFGATGFQYCGNLLPPRLPAAPLEAMLAQLQPLANYLARSFGLKGLNGLDFVWFQERVWTIEINPRPSASLELVDRTYGLRLFEAHVRAFTGYLPGFDLTQALDQKNAAGKAILFAAHDVNVGDTTGWPAQGLRDIPEPGERIEQGHPVCTILAEDTTPDGCWQQLQAKALQLKQQFGKI